MSRRVNPLLLIGTPCCLFVDVVFNADDGSFGRFMLEKEVVWPGVPMLGMQYVETDVTSLRPDHYDIVSIAFDDATDRLHPPRLDVHLKEFDLGKKIRQWNEPSDDPALADMPPRKQTPVTKETCIRSVQEYLEAGWRLMVNELRWHNEEAKTHEIFMFDNHGNVYDKDAPGRDYFDGADEDQDDEDFDDEDDDFDEEEDDE